MGLAAIGTSVGTALPAALRQTWPPFVLIAGLLLIGVVAASDGLFETVGGWLAGLPGGGLALFASLMLLVAAVTVVLNLDTSVVFLTPILLQAARRRGVPEVAFLYGVVFMSNSASLLLPGSNLTNLLVLSANHISGSRLAGRMFGSEVAAVIITAGIVAAWRWKDLRVAGTERVVIAPLRWGLGLAGVVVATVAVLTLANPALVVIIAGGVLVGGQLALGRLSLRKAGEAVNVVTLGGLFCLAVTLGTIARLWGAPGRLMSSSGPWATAWIGAASASVVNNLPASVLLSSRPPAHPLALLVGLDLGPNLVVIGALSAVLWMRVARANGAEPSARTYSKVGVVLVPVSMTVALLALQLFAPGGA